MKLDKIALTIGLANWIIAFTAIVIIIGQSGNKVSTPVDFIMSDYIMFSFIPAFISLLLTLKTTEGFRLVNLIINTTFLLLYALVFMITFYLASLA